MELNKDVEILYIGHSTFLFKTPGGQGLLIDPWVAGNPSCPEEVKKLDRVDTMLITHGHFDHMGDAVSIAREFTPEIACSFELAFWLENQGVQRVMGMNKGGTTSLGDLTVTMTNAHHSSGITDEESGTVFYAGEPSGFVVEFENGFRIYHAGDTCVFGDMELIAQLYSPELVFLPIGDLYTMGPREAAHACRLLQPRWCVPMHYGTFPPLTGTPEAFKKELEGSNVRVLDIHPGEILK